MIVRLFTGPPPPPEVEGEDVAAAVYTRGPWSAAQAQEPIRHRAYFVRDASGTDRQITEGEALGIMLAAALAASRRQ